MSAFDLGMCDPPRFLILSPKHSRGIACWWRADRCGYTEDLNDAGRYTEAEAVRLCRGTYGDAVPVSEAEALELPSRRTIDYHDAANVGRVVS